MTIEDIYGVMFSGSTGQITPEGLRGREKLEQILDSLQSFGVISGWDQDKLDELEDLTF